MCGHRPVASTRESMGLAASVLPSPCLARLLQASLLVARINQMDEDSTRVSRGRGGCECQSALVICTAALPARLRRCSRCIRRDPGWGCVSGDACGWRRICAGFPLSGGADTATTRAHGERQACRPSYRSDVRFQGARSRLFIPRALRANSGSGCSCARQETGPLDVG